MHYALSWEFRELITRESETILPLFLSYSFLSSSLLFGIKIYKTFYWSSIINAGLLRDLKLGVSHDMSFRDLKFRGLNFRELETSDPLKNDQYQLS